MNPPDLPVRRSPLPSIDAVLAVFDGPPTPTGTGQQPLRFEELSPENQVHFRPAERDDEPRNAVAAPSDDVEPGNDAQENGTGDVRELYGSIFRLLGADDEADVTKSVGRSRPGLTARQMLLQGTRYDPAEAKRWER